MVKNKHTLFQVRLATSLKNGARHARTFDVRRGYGDLVFFVEFNHRRLAGVNRNRFKVI